MQQYFGSLCIDDGSSSHDPALNFGSSYSFPSFWIAQTLMHSWAARVLLYDALLLSISWAIENGATVPRLQPIPDSMPPSDFSAQDYAILTALTSDLDKCVEVLRAAQEIAAHNVLKCVRYTFAKEFGVMNLALTLIPVYVVLQYFKKEEMLDEVQICERAIAVYYSRGLVSGELFRMDAKFWKASLRLIEFDNNTN
jgi:hypothetical protein